jgi:TM2 domain-containing membrane protein YozV
MPAYCPSYGSELVNPNAIACPACGDAIRQNTYNEVKNPVLAAALSFFWAGLGQIYNGQTQKGIVYMLAYFFCLVSTLFVFGIVLALLCWFIGMVDAYITANKINNGEFADEFINLI